MIGLGLGLNRSRIIAQRWDPDALDYIAQVETADGQPLEPEVKLAVNRFVRQCKRDASPVAGISNWEAIKACCLMAGPRTLAGALVPLRGPAPTNFNFVAGDYNATLGLTGNSSNKVLNTNYNISTLTTGNIHGCVYSTSALEPAGLRYMFGNQGAGSIELSPNAANDLRGRFNDVSDTILTYPAGTFGNGVGLFLLQRSPDKIDKVQYNFPHGSGEVSSVGTSPGGNIICVFNRNTTSSVGYPGRLSWYSLGESVNEPALRAALDTYMEAIA